jgi:hypothetical protein
MNQIEVSPLLSRHNRSAMPSPLKSRCPTIDHAADTPPILPDDNTVAPFISHNPKSPLPSRHPISLLPSPLKSCVRARAGVRRTGFR